MKRFFSALLVLVALFSLSVSAAPAADQRIELREKDGYITAVATLPTTYWESPTLKAGETVLIPGTLTISNTTNSTRSIFLQSVSFPYSNKAVLEYLNHLTLTVESEGNVIYHAPYSHINDPAVSDVFKTVLEPDASITYTIYLSCDYGYIGDEYCANSILEWQFTTPLSKQDLAAQEKNAAQDLIQRQWLIVSIGSILLVIFTVTYSRKTQQ